MLMPGPWSDAIDLGHGLSNGHFKSSPGETSMQSRLRTISLWAGHQLQPQCKQLRWRGWGVGG